MIDHRMTEILSTGLAVVALVGASLLLGPIKRHQPQDHSSPYDTVSVEQAPWQTTFMMATLGPLRGLAVNVWWYRVEQLKQEGKFFEANQLSQWITQFMPHYPQVWAYHAWNMAYNVSVDTYTQQERWDWVNRGITLLRDKGIVHNPSAVFLYRELGWIFFHKIGQFSDDMQWYYKQRLAMHWELLLGAPTPGASTDEVVAAFGRVANAPNSLEALIEQTPTVQPLLNSLRGLGYKPDEALLQQIGRVRMMSPQFADKPPRLSGNQHTRPADTVYDTRLARTLNEPGGDQAVASLLAYLRKKVLVENYHMDPAFMHQLMQRYGPLDWRHPAAHGCYWSQMGLKIAGKKTTTSAYDRLNAIRDTIHAVQQLSRNGHIFHDPTTESVNTLPDPRFIPAYEKAVLDARQWFEDETAQDPSVPDALQKGHENFLLEAIENCYLYGDRRQAQLYYKKLRQLYGHGPPRTDGIRYDQPLDELVTTLLRTHIESMSTSTQFITYLIMRSFDEGLAQNQIDLYDRFLRIAARAHRQYQQAQSTQAINRQDRLKLAAFHQFVEDSYVLYMLASRHMQDLLKRSRVWLNTDPRLQKRVYARILPKLQQQSQEVGLDPHQMFPNPFSLPDQTQDPVADKPEPPVDPSPPVPQTPDTPLAPIQIERK